MTYEDFNNLTRRRASDKILRGKAFNIAKNPKYAGNQRGHASMVYKVQLIFLKCCVENLSFHNLMLGE